MINIKTIFEKWHLPYYQRKLIRKSGVWFIDIPKTSTTSIRKELGSFFGPVHDKTNEKYSIKAHETSQSMMNFMGENNWNKLFTFSLVRNPWDKTLSFYLWGQKNGYFLDIEFRDFILEIKKQIETGVSRFTWHGPYASCSYYLFSQNGTLLVDFVGKYENRINDLERIRKEINQRKYPKSALLTENNFGNLKINTNESRTRNQYYDKELIQLVENLYSDDIGNFNYSKHDFFDC